MLLVNKTLLLVGGAVATLSVVLCLLQGQPASAGPAQHPAGQSAWQQTDCWFEEKIWQRSSCAWFYPKSMGPDDPAKLPIVRLQESVWGSSPQATIIVMGGPGGSSYLHDEGVGTWRDWEKQLALDHDVVIYDQRGTGLATPRADCPEWNKVTRQLLNADLDLDQLWAAAEPVVQKCLAKVSAAERSAGVYSTVTAARDLRALIEALRTHWGYKEITVYAVSYGTRLAVEALATPLDGVTRVVLDSFYPPGIDAYLAFPDTFARVLSGIESECQRRHDCTPPENGLRKLFGDALKRVEREPIRIRAEDPWQGGWQMVRVDSPTLFALVEHMLYAGIEIGELTRRLREIRDGRIGPEWESSVSKWLYALFDPEFSHVTNTLVECRDNPEITPAQERASLAGYPEWSKALRSPKDSFDFCARAGVPPKPLKPRTIDLPTLLLAAEFDPRTPASLALPAAREFPNLYILSLPITGHPVIEHSQCAARATGAFLNNGDTLLLRSCRKD